MANNFCEKCGTKREANARFCEKCGYRFTDSDIDQSSYEIYEEEPAQYSNIGQTVVLNDESAIFPFQTDEGKSVEAPLTDATTRVKKSSYKGEIFVLLLSVICFIGSLGFYLATKTTVLDSIPFVYNLKHPAGESEETGIPKLTVEMAEEIMNNSTDFPYYYFEEKNMFNKNDYIIHPISIGSGYEVKCYAVDGIDTVDDFLTYFEKYGTRDFIEYHLKDETFYQLKNGKPYFAPCEWTGRYPYNAGSMVLEKIDSETYLTYMWYEDPTVIRYIDGSFKATMLTVDEVISSYIDEEATVTIPKLNGMSLDEAEAELSRAGLKFDRSNITYLATDFLMEPNTVVSAKEYYKKVKPGASIGVYYVVEDPDFYKRGAKNGEEIPELTKEMAAEIMTMADNWPIISFSDKGMIDRENPISISLYDGDERNGYPIVGIETPEEYYEYFSEYATDAVFDKTVIFEYYVVENGKIYLYSVDSGDGGYGADWLIVEKIDEATYFVFDTYYLRENIIIYIDGKFKACAMSPDTVREICSDEEATVKIPDLEGMSVDEAARELNRAGLYLDRSDMTRIKANGWDGDVLIAKYSCKKVKPGSSVGVYLVDDSY